MAAKTQLEILGKKLEEAELLLVTMEDQKYCLLTCCQIISIHASCPAT